MKRIGILPGGRHAVCVTKKQREAICARCLECETEFGSDDPVFTISQSVKLHRAGIGHRKFIYYTVEDLPVEEWQRPEDLLMRAILVDGKFKGTTYDLFALTERHAPAVIRVVDWSTADSGFDPHHVPYYYQRRDRDDLLYSVVRKEESCAA